MPQSICNVNDGLVCLGGPSGTDEFKERYWEEQIEKKKVNVYALAKMDAHDTMLIIRYCQCEPEILLHVQGRHGPAGDGEPTRSNQG